MKIRFIARKFTLTDDVKERVQKKLQKLDKFFPPETEATVALYGRKDRRAHRGHHLSGRYDFPRGGVG